jgi:hypothetical protein
VRLACGKAFVEDALASLGGTATEVDQQYESLNQGKEDGTTCTEFIIRAKLGGGDPDSVLRGKRTRHNAHAPERTEYPGSQELFGSIFKPPSRRALPQRQALPQPPDLGVKRHIKHGKNIKD